MRAAVVHAPGGLDRLSVRDVPAPRPGRGEVVVDVAYAGCNWGDVQKRQGIYPDPVDYPAVLGAEVAGRVRSVGPGVRGLRPAMPVAAITGPAMLGGFAEQVAVPASYAMELPEPVDLRAGAAFPVVALTAYHLLHTAHRVRRGEAILVHAIGGALGLVLTQLAVAAGARVIGTVGSRAKAQRALALGSERVVVRGGEDFVAAAMEATAGRGVDLVIDSLGADILPRSFDALRPFGRVINIGEAAGEPDFPVRKKLYERSTSLSGFEVLHAEPGSSRWRRGVRRVTEALAAGTLEVPIEDIYPLVDVAKAQARLEGRGVRGKLLIAVHGEDSARTGRSTQ